MGEKVNPRICSLTTTLSPHSLNGKLNLNINMLGGKVVGMEISSERKNVRINYYIAMANSYSVLLTYKLKI